MLHDDVNPNPVYEGVDYSNKANRADAAGGGVPFQFIDTGKRERKKIPSYNEERFYRQQKAAAIKKRTLVSGVGGVECECAGGAVDGGERARERERDYSSTAGGYRAVLYNLY